MKRRPFAGAFALLLAALVCIPPLPAQTISFPDLAGDPRAFAFARRRDYTWQDLGEIALWASGTGGQDAATLEGLIQNTVAELLASPELPGGTRERGEYILSFMHRRFFRAYSERQTRLDELFRTGRYNCVSSAALYTLFASAAGLDVRGVITKDHAFVTVQTETGPIDVETTNPLGFDPGSRREFHDGFGKLTGFAYVPARNYRDRTAISPLELVSLIMSNRVSDLESRGRYAEAVTLAVNRAILLTGRRDPVSSPFFAEPQKDRLDRLFNYGASLVNSGQESAAIQWAVLAGGQYPDGDRWQEFIFTALNNLLVKLMRNQRIAEARNALDTSRSLLSRDAYAELDALILDAELARQAQDVNTAGEAQAFLLSIEDIRIRSALGDKRLGELRDFVILREGERLSRAGGFRDAIAYIEAALARYGRDPGLENALRVYRTNRVAELHNAFAARYNQGDYTGAAGLIRAALEEFPGERRLTADLKLAERAAQPR